jgi:hypothetical protein
VTLAPSMLARDEAYKMWVHVPTPRQRPTSFVQDFLFVVSYAVVREHRLEPGSCG